MAITTYSELQTAVKNWLHRAGMDSIIPDLISLGEDRIYRNLRVRAMETLQNLVMASGEITVPSDYVDMKAAKIETSDDQWLERKSVEWIFRNDRARELSPGTPRYIARRADTFIFSPYPSQDFTVAMLYYKRLDSVSSATNSIFTTNPGLWLFGALAESAPFIQHDKRLPMWEAKFSQLLNEVNSEEYREGYSGSNLAMTADLMSHP